ncbi:senescence/dehydration-associated protein, chloroplastic-like [Salvia divinorum]|uniref:Senescence/dehydration-associated protein, chloroplastic-like n=1 Tax=Salvia divinorum TaxID=28513 RepID=A0ABD1I5K9_SALDI
MKCCRPTKSTTERNLSQQASNYPQNNSSINVRRDSLLRIPECRVILMNEGEAVELATGDLEFQWISDGNVALVGEELQWPLTKDEPVVKLDALNYPFSLEMNDGQPLSYGMAFAESSGGLLGLLDVLGLDGDVLLTKHCSFIAGPKKRNVGIDWKEFAPAVDKYSTLLGQTFAKGTGHFIRGIFRCTEAYTNKVQEIGEKILIPASLDKALIHATKLTKMTDEITKTMLNVVEEASESVEEVRLASNDAVKKLLEATETARDEAMKARADAVQTAVTHRCGKRAGEREITGHVFQIVGNCASVVCNIFKIRKATNTLWTAICCSDSKKKMD